MSGMSERTPSRRTTKADLEAQLAELQAERERLAKANEQLQQRVESAVADEKVFVSVRISRALREQAKDLGRQLDLSLQAVVGDALQQWVTRKTAELEADPHLPLGLDLD